MLQLQADILQIPRAENAPEFLGLGSMDASGVLQLGSTGATAAALEALALWTAEHVAAHPGLARLRNTRMLRIDGDRITMVHSADDLWRAIPAQLLPGTMADSARLLGALQDADEAWFWLSAAGPDSLPWLAVAPRQQPATEFAETVRALLRRSPPGTTGIKGVVRMLAGRLMLTTADDIDGWQDAISALQAHRIPQLTALGMLQLVAGRIKAAETWGSTAASVDLSAQSAILSTMSEGERVWFWFAADSASGPMLLLAEDRAALKLLVTAAGATEAVYKGQLRKSKKGWLEFMPRGPGADFIPRLAGFVATHRAAWPTLTLFIGARMTRRDADGNILARIKDDQAWQSQH